MPTVASKCIIKEMTRKRGRYRNGPQALAIYEYTVGAGIIKRWFVAFTPEDLVELEADREITSKIQIWPRRSMDA